MALSRRAWFRSLLAAPVGVYAAMKGIAALNPPSATYLRRAETIQILESWRKTDGVVYLTRRFVGHETTEVTPYKEIPFVIVNPLEVPWSWHRSS